MGRSDLSWAECEVVIEAESRRYERMGRAIGLERDDLKQEASIAAVQCLRAWSPEGGGRSAYVRRAVRNRFADVKRKALREMRMPHDGQGRPQLSWVMSYELLAEDNALLTGAGPDNGRWESRALLRVIHEQLSQEDWDFLVETLVYGAHLARGLAPARRKALHVRLEEVQEKARRIVRRVLEVEEPPMSAIPMPAPEELPECHAKGEQPQGYDVEDGVCWNCRDKFTCLPDAIERGLIDGKLAQDQEVEGVVSGSMTFRMAINRMKARKDIMDRGGTVPHDLEIGHAPEAKSPRAPAPAPAPEPPTETRARVTKPEAKKAKPTKAAKKAAPKKAAVKVAKKAAPKKRKYRKDHRGRATMHNGKLLPPVRSNTKEQQAAALARVKIGQPFDLKVGMQLVRKTKNGEHIIVKIKPLGFELDGVTYSSLSTAIMYKLRKMTSGNAYFHLEHNHCTEVWSASGKVLAGHSSQ